MKYEVRYWSGAAWLSAGYYPTIQAAADEAQRLEQAGYTIIDVREA